MIIMFYVYVSLITPLNPDKVQSIDVQKGNQIFNTLLECEVEGRRMQDRYKTEMRLKLDYSCLQIK